MAPRIMPLTFLLATFLHLSWSVPAVQDNARQGPILVSQPEPSYYSGWKKPATLVCAARNADDVRFTCVGVQVPASSTETDEAYDGSDVDLDTIRASITVPRGDVINYHRQKKAELAAAGRKGARFEPFWCRCDVIGLDGEVAVSSPKTVIRVAHLSRRFKQQPTDALVKEGDNAELLCGAPRGDPTPKITWWKDSLPVDIESDPRILVTDHGSLVIREVEVDDVGIYKCVARNMVGRRESQEAELSVADALDIPDPSSVVVSDASGRHVEVVKSRTPRQTAQLQVPRFTTEPKSSYFVGRDTIAQIKCYGVGFNSIVFQCEGARFNMTPEIDQGADMNQNKIIQATLKLNYDQLTTETNNRGTRCKCLGWYLERENGEETWKNITTSARRGRVAVASMGEFRMEPTDQSVQVGTEATLVCEPPRGNPRVYVEWHKDDQKIDFRRQSSRFSLSRRGHMTIKSVEMSDAGSYVCEARNRLGMRKRSKPAQITVSSDAPATTESVEETTTLSPKTGKNVYFVRNLPSEAVLGADGTYNLTCAAVGATYLRLDCDRIRISEEQLNIVKGKDPSTGKQMLTMNPTITEEMLEASSGRASCKCTAIFHEVKWKYVYSQKMVIRVASEDGETPRDNYIGDRFRQVPRNTEVMWESAAQLACAPPDGYPTPTVYWRKDGERIDPRKDRNFRVRSSGPLIIQSVRPEDEGMYECIAQNSAGMRATNPAQLTVSGKPTTVPSRISPSSGLTKEEMTTPDSVDPTEEEELAGAIYIVQPANITYIYQEEAVNLTCQAYGTSYLFFNCDNSRHSDTNGNGGSMQDPETGENIIYSWINITRETIASHMGDEPYTCFCEAHFNVDGNWEMKRSSSGQVVIAYLERRFMKDPQMVTPVVGAQVVIECEPPSGEPKPMVYWTKDNERVENSRRVMVQGPGNLVINRFSEADKGQYICVAESAVAVRRSRPVSVYPNLVIDPTEEPTSDQKTTSSREDGSDPGTNPGGVIENPDKFFQPYFTKDLDNHNFVVKKKPTSMTCEASDVETIVVNCGEQNLQEPMLEIRKRVQTAQSIGETTRQQEITEANFQVTRAFIKEYGTTDNSTVCICKGVYRKGEEQKEITSTMTYVKIASLQKKFTEPPQDQTVEEGHFITIRCLPPKGVPDPTVSWTKNGEEIEVGREMILINSNLVINAVTSKDAGVYSCVAKNVMGTRTSKPMTLTVKGRMEETTGGDGGTDVSDGMDKGSEGSSSAMDVRTTMEMREGREEGVTTTLEGIITDDGEDVTKQESMVTDAGQVTTHEGIIIDEGGLTRQEGTATDGGESQPEPEATAEPTGVSEEGTSTDDGKMVDKEGTSTDDGKMVDKDMSEVDPSPSAEVNIPVSEGEPIDETVDERITSSPARETGTDINEEDGANPGIREGVVPSSSGEVGVTSSTVEDGVSSNAIGGVVTHEQEDNASSNTRKEGDTSSSQVTPSSKDMNGLDAIDTSDMAKSDDKENEEVTSMEGTVSPGAVVDEGMGSASPEGEPTAEGMGPDKGMTEMTPGSDGVNVNGIPAGQTCQAKMINCSPPLDMDACMNLDEYRNCMVDVESECSNIAEFIRQSLMDTEEKCQDLFTCNDRISRCGYFHQTTDSFNVKDFCSQVDTVYQCVNDALIECGAESSETSDHQQMLQDYCNAVVDVETSVGSCESMNTCSFKVIMADYTSEFWCSTMVTLAMCGGEAVDTCALDELRSPQADFEAKVDEVCLSDMKGDGMGGDGMEGDDMEGDDMEGDGMEGDGMEGDDMKGDGMGEGEAGEAEGQGGDTEGDGQDGGTAAGQEGEEGGANEEGGSNEAETANQQEGDRDSGSVTGVSLLLTVALQLIVAVLLSRR